MKKLLTITLLALSLSTVAQNEEKYVYCELLGTQKFMSLKLNVSVDIGEKRAAWIKDEATGKLATFNSMVDALNYMGEDGWEFVQAYIVSAGQSNVYHWLLKKKKNS